MTRPRQKPDPLQANTTPTWLRWAQRLRAIAQNGLAFSDDAYHLERFTEVAKIAQEMETVSSTAGEHQPIPFEFGYATPKLDVRGVVMRDGKILLVRERSDEGWTLPGGWVEVGESLSEAVEREVFEEAGCVVRAQRILAVYDRTRHAHPPMRQHVYKVFVECQPVGRRSVPIGEALETSACDFYEPSCLPELSPQRITEEQLRRVSKIAQDPSLPADFD